MKINIEDKIRFEKKIEKSANGCWIWTGSKNSKGYGRVRIDKKEYMAHRISYNIYLGEIPYGLFICHKCDNPSCVNPEHLFTGTARDNTQDMLSKNRRIYTKEYRKNLSIAHLGKTLSEEHKAKISASLMGNTINLGRKQDPEIVAKRIAKTHETMRINKLNNNLTI